MSNLIKCPYCNKEIELSEALTHQIRESERDAIEKDLSEKIREKFLAENELKMRDKENETKELREQNKKLGEQLLELNKTLRKMQEKDDTRELETQKIIFAEKEKAKAEAGERQAEENRLKLLEKDKQIADMKKSLEEARRKAEQGSQQTQGEVLELDLEESLRTAFPSDEIQEVKKGSRGADLIQIVKTPMDNSAGKIIWESKNYDNKWSDGWIEKLKQNQRAEKNAIIAALITKTMPKNAKREIININKIWVTAPKHFIALATLLRDILLEGAKQKAISAQSSGVKEELFEYINSADFIHQMEAIYESYTGMKNQIQSEKNSFERQWKQREMQLIKIHKSLFNMVGGLSGISGSNFPQIKGLDLLESGKAGSKEVEKQKLL